MKISYNKLERRKQGRAGQRWVLEQWSDFSLIYQLSNRTQSNVPWNMKCALYLRGSQLLLSSVSLLYLFRLSGGWSELLSIVSLMSSFCLCFVSQEDDPNCYLQWNDSYVSSERVAELKPYQRINHFPGMGEICRFLFFLVVVVVVEVIEVVFGCASPSAVRCP